MHITIRRYKTDSPKEVARLANERLIPLESKVAGFVAFYGIETGKESWTSVSVFEPPAGAEESNRVAVEFTKSDLDAYRLIKSKPEITAGSVLAHKTK